MLIHKMLEETAKRYPQNIAVKHGDRTITFFELDMQSSKIATFLHSKGVKEGDRVALIAGKSIRSVVSIFGILKSGAMYVPIDYTTPEERLKYILDDCGVNVAIAGQNILRTYHDTLIEKELLLFTKEANDVGFMGILKNIWIASYNELSLDVNIEISKDASAYIIYTSGSTGEPKGVEIYHHSVTNLMEWYTKEFNITTKDKILSFVPFWFDASICDLFSMAKAGATLVLPPDGINIFPNEFAQFLVDEKISLFFAPSSQFVLALDALKELKYPHLKTVMFGAEELPIKYVKEMREVFSGCELVNIYGPTECTDVATFYRVPEEIPEDMKKIPIGQPYLGVGAIIVREEGFKFVTTGELAIAGHQIMKGYWNKPKETEKAISKCIYPLYYTGDIVEQDINGDYVYVGRKDRQIKSMGRRIQLEEIEHVLNEHPLVKEAVVTSEQDVNVESCINIKCCVVPLAPLIEGEITRYCRTRLPDYMVPTKVYVCESLPKMSNGKANRRELK